MQLPNPANPYMNTNPTWYPENKTLSFGSISAENPKIFIHFYGSNNVVLIQYTHPLKTLSGPFPRKLCLYNASVSTNFRAKKKLFSKKIFFLFRAVFLFGQ